MRTAERISRSPALLKSERARELRIVINLRLTDCTRASSGDLLSAVRSRQEALIMRDEEENWEKPVLRSPPTPTRTVMALAARTPMTPMTPLAILLLLSATASAFEDYTFDVVDTDRPITFKPQSRYSVQIKG